VNEARLRELLRELPLPDEGGAEERGLRVVLAAFEQRRPAPRPLLPRLALALAIAALLAALVLSPAGAAVRGWIGDVFTAGVPNARPGLTRIPGGGRLLVQTPAGPWVVQPDGSRRLLGRYDAATWSPHGLYVGAAAGRTLTAVEPDGTPHWSLSARGRISDPRWSPSGYRIAFRAGRGLRVVAGDGSDERLLARRVAPVAPAWAPQGLDQLAYVASGRRLRVADTESGATIGSARALPGIESLEWAAGGSTLLEASPAALRLRRLTVHKLLGRLGVGAPRRLPLPAGARVRDAALSPDGRFVAALLVVGAGTGPPEATASAVSRGLPRSEVVLVPAAGGERPRRLFATSGRLSELAWSPDGSRLLIAWPEADQWLFVPTSGRARVSATGDVAAQFAPGGRAAAFPRLEGWCCRAR
jgi:hypothetical protein